MLTVQEVYDIIDGFAPFASQESWDNSGLLVGSMTQPAERILTTLDISEEVITQAVQQQVQLIVAHHPVIFSAESAAAEPPGLPAGSPWHCGNLCAYPIGHCAGRSQCLCPCAVERTAVSGKSAERAGTFLDRRQRFWLD